VISKNHDIVHLHWVSGGFLHIESLKRLHSPIVWTLHDMWPFTGGCHYSGGCNRYQNACGSCPILGSHKDHDMSHWIISRKRKTLEGLNLNIIAPSRWMSKCVQSSSLCKNARVEVIPNGLDTARYRPVHKGICRELLGLPKRKKLIGFGAIKSTQDERKGFQLLADSLRCLASTHAANQTEVVVFGASQPDTPLDLGLRAHYLGTLHDDISLALLYAACDIFVAPSVEDNLPNTLIEAMSCGTPCAAFRIGGMPDLIEHESTGYLARPFDVHDLTRGLVSMLTDDEHLERLSRMARQKAEQEYSLEKIATRHLKLYEDILANHPTPSDVLGGALN
jgi:glycosyltransferase involved in cell wall biosynthesis